MEQCNVLSSFIAAIAMMKHADKREHVANSPPTTVHRLKQVTVYFQISILVPMIINSLAKIGNGIGTVQSLRFGPVAKELVI